MGHCFCYKLVLSDSMNVPPGRAAYPATRLYTAQLDIYLAIGQSFSSPCPSTHGTQASHRAFNSP